MLCELSQTDTRKLSRFFRLYPWFGGLSADHLFWVAIDTLYLSTVKGLSSAEIVSLTTIALIVGIAGQWPIVWLMGKIGNTASLQIGTALILASALCLTFGTGYGMMALGGCLREIGYTFHNIINAILKNNLTAAGRNGDFIAERTKATTVYSVATAVIAVIAGPMFNLNPYLPMIGCIAFCAGDCVLAVYMEEIKAPSATVNSERPQKTRKFSWQSLKLPLIVVVAVAFFALYYPVANSAQSEGKLFIQEEMLKVYEVETVTLLISAMLFMSRIVRVASNIFFEKLYKKYKDSVIFGFLILLSLSVGILIFAYDFELPTTFRFGLMMVDYAVILFLRDPFKSYIQGLILNYTEKEKQATVLALLEFVRRIVRAGMSYAFTAILLDAPFITVIYALLGLSFIAAAIGVTVFFMLKKQKSAVSAE